MVLILRYFILTCAALCLLKASSNESPDQLFNFASKHPKHAPALLYKSAYLGHEGAAQALLSLALSGSGLPLPSIDTFLSSSFTEQDNSTFAKHFVLSPSESAYWLAELTNLRKVPFATITPTAASSNNVISNAAFGLAMLETRKSLQKYWLNMAAHRGHAKAQFELSLLLQDDSKRLALLESSANSDYPVAVVTLAKYYYQRYSPSLFQTDNQAIPTAGKKVEAYPNRMHNKALKWLTRAAQYDPQSAFLLAGLKLRMGEQERAQTWYEQAALGGYEKAQGYASALSEHNTKAISELFIRSVPLATNEKTCAQQLQFVAGNIHSLVQARAFKQAFENDPRFEGLSICINPVAWVAPSKLGCDLPKVSQRVNCDLSAFSEVLSTPNFSHLVVFSPLGKAYVQRGVMYLDQSDEYSVFVHELAHFANFVDEYALSPVFAHKHCRISDAPNLMLQSHIGALDKRKLARWERALQQANSKQENSNALSLSLAASRTCENAELTSIKPSADITFLEHHDIEYIPPLYLTLWQQELNKQAGELAVSKEFLYLAKMRLKAQTASDSTSTTNALKHWSALSLQARAKNLPMHGLENSLSTSP